MVRSMVGLLAAVGAAMSALVGMAHGGLIGLIVALAAVAKRSSRLLGHLTKKMPLALQFASVKKGRVFPKILIAR